MKVVVCVNLGLVLTTRLKFIFEEFFKQKNLNA